MEKELFLTEIRKTLNEVQEAATIHTQLANNLSTVLRNDVTFSSLEDVRKYLSEKAIPKKQVQKLEKIMKARALARLAGK
jgi:hypothetical protein